MQKKYNGEPEVILLDFLKKTLLVILACCCFVIMLIVIGAVHYDVTFGRGKGVSPSVM